jgi:hypothetical protein
MRLPADDSGVASERTALAWLRTGAVYATLGGLSLTVAAHHDRWLFGIATAAIFVMCGYGVGRHGAVAYARRRRDEWCVGSIRAGMTITAATLVAACATFGALLAFVA